MISAVMILNMDTGRWSRHWIRTQPEPSPEPSPAQLVPQPHDAVLNDAQQAGLGPTKP